MVRGSLIGTNLPPAHVYEAAFGAPVQVEFRLIDSETSFFEDTLSIDLVISNETKIGKFLQLHPWFCQHIIFVWGQRGKTHNVMLTSYRMCMAEPNATVICGVRIQPVDALTACDVIEESRLSIENYDGTNASDFKDKHDAKQYFKSGLIPRLDI